MLFNKIIYFLFSYAFSMLMSWPHSDISPSSFKLDSSFISHAFFTAIGWVFHNYTKHLLILYIVSIDCQIIR